LLRYLNTASTAGAWRPAQTEIDACGCFCCSSTDRGCSWSSFLVDTMQYVEPHHDSWRSGEMRRVVDSLYCRKRVSPHSTKEHQIHTFEGFKRQETVFDRRRGAGLIITTMIKSVQRWTRSKGCCFDGRNAGRNVSG
jgi:hypothetical protein